MTTTHGAAKVTITSLAGLLLGAACPAWPAPITFNTALPVHEGGWVLREQFVLSKNADDPDPAADRNMRASGLVSVLGYGVSRDFALFGVLPYLDKRLDVNVAGERVTRSDEGVGDLTVIGRYTAYTSDAPGRTFRIAPFLGVKAPTGPDDARDDLGRLPPTVQLGAGSWDFLGGVVATHQTLDFQVDAQLAYRANREANGFRFGDVGGLDVSLQYRLWPQRLGSGIPAFLYGVLEANLVHARKNRLGGIRDPNSGGTTLFLSPGLQYVTRKWILEAGVQIPVVQDLNGTALKNDHIFNAGFRINL
ncbi:MAG: transporter [Betaproteobacteria bacterium]|nr:transporter [Betaproteobacteria bacterium]